MDFNQEILELLSASLQRQDRMVEQLGTITGELQGFRKDVNERFESVEDRLGRIEHQQIATNLSIQELWTSVKRLNEQMENFAQHEDRIRKLESFMRKAS